MGRSSGMPLWHSTPEGPCELASDVCELVERKQTAQLFLLSSKAVYTRRLSDYLRHQQSGAHTICSLHFGQIHTSSLGLS